MEKIRGKIKENYFGGTNLIKGAFERKSSQGFSNDNPVSSNGFLG